MDAGLVVAIVAVVVLLVALAALIYRVGGIDDEETRRIESGEINRDAQLRERQRWEAQRNREVAEHYDHARSE